MEVRMRIQTLTLAAAILAAASFSGPVQAAGPATIRLGHKAPFGGYLTDATGRTLYIFTADHGGKSSCYEACATAWPPLVTSGKPMAASGVDAAHLGTSARHDGARQVTYHGMPLYYFKGDAAGATAGEEINHFGGEWYVVSPKGVGLEKEGTPAMESK
jgi:predicted lipoprotein with Yx(FWY)xxD motif